MIRYILPLILTISFACSETIDVENEQANKVDCLILQDENSIICKYEHERSEEDKEVLVQWLDPNGELSRERTLIIPAGHGSIYDFRYIEGRMKGIWEFKVKENEQVFITNFTLE